MSARSRDLAIVGRDVSLLLHVPALMALVSLPVCWLTDDSATIDGLLVVAALGLTLGQIGYRALRHAGPTRLHQAMVTAALAWLVVPMLGALPFLLQPSLPGEWNESLQVFQAPRHALFESFSGFTGTGLSVAPRASELPPGLQWWRTFSQWIGGIGVIALMLTVLDSGSGFYRLYYSEARARKILPTVTGTTRAIWVLYLPMSALAVLAMWGAGLPWWQALNHGLTGISTGGFSITDDSFAGYALAPRLVAIATMLAGALSFGTYYSILQERRLSPAVRDMQTRGLLALTATGFGACLILAHVAGSAVDEPSRLLFLWASALATAGFSAAPVDAYGTLVLLLFVAAMVVGAAAGSTGGGIKQFRLWLLVRSVGWEVREFVRQPRQVVAYRFDGSTIHRHDVQRLVARAALFVVAWIALALLAAFALLATLPEGHGFGLDDVIFEACSAQANVGLSTGLTSASLSAAAEGVLIVTMWIGRLEIIPVLVLLRGLAHVVGRRQGP